MSQTDVGIRVVVLGAAQASRILGNVRDDLSRFGAGIASHTSAVEQFGRSIVRTGDAVSSLGRTMTYTITTPIVGALGALTNAGIQFEDAFAGVSKTVDGVAVGFADVAKQMYGTAKGLTDAQKAAVFAEGSIGDLTTLGEELRDDFRNLSREIPITASELAGIGQVAGQLGVRGRENIVEFTEIVAKLGVATDLSAEQAAFAIARMGNIMGVATDDMGKFAKEFGNAIVALGNTSAATESEITNLAYRISGAGRAAGMTMPQILGLSAALAAAGVKAEMGGSAVSKILTTLSFAVNNFNQSAAVFSQRSASMESSIGSLQQAISSGVGVDQLKADFSDLDLSGLEADLRAVANGTMSLGDVINGVRIRSMAGLNKDMSEAQGQLQLFARATGMTTEALASMIRSDPTQAFKLVVQGISNMQEAGTLTNDVLNEMELNTIRLKDVILRLGPNMDLVTTSVNTANTAWIEQIALEEEAAKRFKTMKSMIQLAKNALTDLGITIFDLVKDDMAKMIKGVGLLVDGFKALDPALQKTIIRVGLLVSAVGPLLLIGGTLLQLVGNNIIGFDRLGKAIMGVISLPFTPFTKAFGSLGGLFGKLSNTKTRKGIFNKFFNSLKKGGGILSAIKGVAASWGSLLTTSFKNVLKPISNIGKGLFDSIQLAASSAKFGILNAFKGLKSGLVNTFTNAISFIKTRFFDLYYGVVTTFTSIGKFFSSVFMGPLSLVFGALKTVLIGPIKLVSSALGMFGKAFASVFGEAIGLVGKLGGKLLSLIPVFGKFLFTGLPGIVTKLAVVIGGLFALLFAPKIISAVIKNRDALFDELKIGFKQFGEDVKNLGLEKSILLFFSGGSTGSGRRGGIYGIALTLGASEDAAKRFAYAMGTASYWVIKIVKDTKMLVSRMIAIATASDRLGTSTKSTSDRLSSFAGGFAKFLEGLSSGWVNSFDDIIGAFTVFVSQVRVAIKSVGGLFDAIFGGTEQATEGVQSFYDTLAPGAETGAMRIGRTVGEVIGGLVTLAIQGFTFLVSITSVIADAFTTIVTAYKEGGVKGVFEELGPLLADVFNGFVDAAAVLWDSVQPKLSDFLSAFGAWILSDGIPAIWAGAKSLFSVIADALDAALFGTDEIVQQAVIGYRFEFKSGAYAGTAPLDYMNDVRSPFATNPDQFNREDVVGNQVIPAKEGLVSKLGKLIGDITDYLQSDDVKNRLRDAFHIALGAISDIGTFLWEGGDEFAGLRSYLSDAFDLVVDWFKTNAIPRMRGIGRYLWQELAAGLLAQATDAIALGIPGADLLFEATGLGDAIDNQLVNRGGLNRTVEDYMNEELAKVNVDTTAIEDNANAAGQRIGANIGNGLSTGMTDSQTSVGDATDYLINGALIDRANTTLETHSPSKVFYRVGKNVVAGLVQGLRETYVLQSAMSIIQGMFYNFASNIIMALAPARTEIIGFMALTSQLVNSVGSIVNSLSMIASALTPTAQQVNSMIVATNTLIGLFDSLSNVMGGLFNNLPGGNTTNTTNINTYSPTIFGNVNNPVQANNQMYNVWTRLGGGVNV
jgi:hypothetical protein